MVEKGAAMAARWTIGVRAVAARAIGRTALQLMLALCRIVREAMLQMLRLKADMIRLASGVPERPQ